MGKETHLSTTVFIIVVLLSAVFALTAALRAITLPMYAGADTPLQTMQGEFVQIYCTEDGLRRNAFVERDGKPRYESVPMGFAMFGYQYNLPTVLVCLV